MPRCHPDVLLQGTPKGKPAKSTKGAAAQAAVAAAAGPTGRPIANALKRKRAQAEGHKGKGPVAAAKAAGAGAVDSGNTGGECMCSQQPLQISVHVADDVHKTWQQVGYSPCSQHTQQPYRSTLPLIKTCAWITVMTGSQCLPYMATRLSVWLGILAGLVIAAANAASVMQRLRLTS
jgi:hypothetical protein